MNTYIGSVYNPEGRIEKIIVVNAVNKIAGEKKIRRHLCNESDFKHSRNRLYVDALKNVYELEISAKVHSQSCHYFKR